MLRMSDLPSRELSRLKLTLVDPDCIAPENILLSPIFRTAFEASGRQLYGQSKSAVAASFLRSHGVATTALPCEIADVSWHRLRDLDLLVSCPDNALARVETTLVARTLRLPLLDAGVLGETAEGGRVSCFSPVDEAACYLCALSEQRRADLLSFAASASLGCRPSPEAAMRDAPLGRNALQHTATILVQVLWRWFLAPSEPPAQSSALRLYPRDGAWREERVTLRRSASCPWHPRPHGPFVSVEPDQTFAEALHAFPAGDSRRIQFAWPVCLLAVCECCGALDAQPRRVALVHRQGRCPHCNTPQPLTPRHTVASIGSSDPMAQKTPRQLGWSDRQLFVARPVFTPGREQEEH